MYKRQAHDPSVAVTPKVGAVNLAAMNIALEQTAQLPPLTRDDQEPVFAAPWQAEAFALTVSLHQRGVFEWSEWAQHLAAAIRRAQQNGDPDLGDTYYLHWLGALEDILVTKGIASTAALGDLQERWRVAAAATPHGEPISID